MKRKIFYFVLLIIGYGCSQSHCGFIENNENTFNQLITLIKENPTEFSNALEGPRIYYTFNYQKEFSEFKKTRSTENINKEDYEILKEIFDKFSIEKLVVFEDQNILFQVGNTDIFVSNYNIYLGQLKGKSINEISKDIDIIAYEECHCNWYYLLERTSIAN